MPRNVVSGHLRRSLRTMAALFLKPFHPRQRKEGVRLTDLSAVSGWGREGVSGPVDFFQYTKAGTRRMVAWFANVVD